MPTTTKVPEELHRWLSGRGGVRAAISEADAQGVAPDCTWQALRAGWAGEGVQIYVDDESAAWLSRWEGPRSKALARVCSIIRAAEAGELLTPERVRAAASGWP